MTASNTINTDRITYEELKQCAREHGCVSTYGLLLLGGPDFYAGIWEEYNEVLYLLNRNLSLNKPEQ